MENNQEIYKKLREQYSDEELADSIMIPEELSEEEEKQAREEFIKWRLKKRREMSEQEKILSGLLSIKYQIKSYVNSSEFNKDKSLSHFLNRYLEVVKRNQKTLAEEIDIHPSRLNRIIKGKEKIGKSIAYRLETHSGELIPAIYWWRLMQKEVEQEILTEKKEREMEKKHVKKIVYRA
jgi:plasmid maintenance system antidote protein VapI